LLKDTYSFNEKKIKQYIEKLNFYFENQWMWECSCEWG
jgi:hypothetical protein